MQKISDDLEIDLYVSDKAATMLTRCQTLSGSWTGVTGVGSEQTGLIAIMI